MQFGTHFAGSEGCLARYCLHRPQQRREIVAHQHAHRPQRAAKVSATPGKTRLINHFCINDSWYLVDLPGYGYARTSKSERGAFSKIITDYVFKCEKMFFLFVLVDIRLEPQRIDLDFINLLGEHGVPFGLIFTKADKRSKAQRDRSIATYKKVLEEQWEELPPHFISSSEQRVGRDEILNFIEECLKTD